MLEHPKTVEELLSIDSNVQGFFNFQRALSIDAINHETKCLDRKAHLFWEIPVIDSKINELMDVLSFRGDAKYKLTMAGKTKDVYDVQIKKENCKSKSFLLDKEAWNGKWTQKGIELCRLVVYDV